ncbi:MAG: cytochrome c-type biogenesis CcmF C-terminal domain-containing protein, partial [Phycisphaerales bacterium JB038]
EAITVKPEFYNKIVAPMGLLLAFIMAHGPLLAFGRSAPAKIIKDVTPAGLSAVVLTALAAVLWTSNPWALITVFIASLGSFVVIIGFVKTVAARCKGTGENPLLAPLRLIDADKRRYGAQIAHLGVMLIILGVVGSSLFKVEEHVILKRGVPTEVEDYTLTLRSVGDARGPNYDALKAVVDVTGPKGATLTLEPEKRRYDKWQRQINTEVALHSSLGKDVYLILGGAEPDGSLISLQILISPLVVWIWLGGIVLSAGGVYAMLPRFLPRVAHEAVVETAAADPAQPLNPSPAAAGMRPVPREAQQAETSQ